MNEESLFAAALQRVGPDRPAFLDPYAMSFYDWFARRAEAREPVNYTEAWRTGESNPFHLATGGRAVLISRIKDDLPASKTGGK